MAKQLRKAVFGAPKRLTDGITHVALGAYCAAMATVYAGAAHAQVEIRGALETNQQALDAVDTSVFTGDGVETASQSALDAILYIVGAFGVLLVAFGINALYKHYKQGDQARDEASKGIWMIGIGGCMTIPAIITAVFPNLLMDGI